jgi:hypothetical protein
MAMANAMTMAARDRKDGIIGMTEMIAGAAGTRASPALVDLLGGKRRRR